MKNQNTSIENSIASYKDLLLNDINLTIRLTVNEKDYMTKIVEWHHKQLIIDAPLEKLDWVLFFNDTYAKITFVSKKAIFTSGIKFVRHYRKNDRLYYSVEILEPLEKLQQRQYFRLDILLPIHYALLPKEDSTPEGSSDPVIYKGTSVNISMGGLCLVTDKQLQKSDQLSMKLDFMSTALELSGEVLFNGEKNAIGSYTHRIKFSIEDRTLENTLHKLIFEKQRLLLGKPNKPLN